MNNLTWHLAMDLWREAVAAYLVAGGLKTNQRRKGETASKLIAATLYQRLTEHKPYWRGLLAPHIHSSQQGIPFKKHIAHEASVYSQVLLRRITLTNQKASGTPGWRGDLTNAHRLLLLLLPYVSPSAKWQTPTLVRYPDLQPGGAPADITAQTLASRLDALYEAEQERHKQARRSKGEPWSFGRISASPSWIEGYNSKGRRPAGTWGILHLHIGSLCVPVPEEMGLADVFNCLPSLLDQRLTAEILAGQAAARGQGSGGAALPQGYKAWRLFCRIIENMNEPYGKQMIPAGIPSSVMFPDPGGAPALTRPDCDDLVAVRKEAWRQSQARLGARYVTAAQAQAAPTARPAAEDPRHAVAVLQPGVARDTEDADWEAAWTVLFGKKPPLRYKDGGFEAFRWSAEGEALLAIRWLDIDAEVGPADVRRPVDGAPSADEAAFLRLEQWQRTRSLTPAESLLARPALIAGDRLDDLFNDPQVMADADAAMAESVPYRLLPSVEDRRAVLRFFFQRRICLLEGWGCVRSKDKKGWRPAGPMEQGEVPMTDAERIVLDLVHAVNDAGGNPARSSSSQYQATILASLRSDPCLKQALGRFPYKQAAKDDRLRLMLFFYCRDIEGSLIRPE